MSVIGEVRVFDAKGNLKTIITQEELLKRNMGQMEELLDCERARLTFGGSKKSSDMINCQVCKKEVEQKRAGKKYCSWQCSQIASGKRIGFNKGTKVYIEAVKPTVTACPQCKKEFTLERTDQKYCGKQCRKQRDNQLASRVNKSVRDADKRERINDEIDSNIIAGKLKTSFVPTIVRPRNTRKERI